MKNKFVIIAGVLQFMAIILFIGIVKSAAGLAIGTVDVSTFVLMVVLALIFQGLSYSLSKRHPEEHAKANQTINHSDKRYGFLALLFLVIAIAMLFTFTLDSGVERILLQIGVIIIGVLAGMLIFTKK